MIVAPAKAPDRRIPRVADATADADAHAATDIDTSGNELKDAGTLTDWAQRVAMLPVADDDPGRIDQVRALEELKCACSAAQARVTAAFAASQRAKADTRGDGVTDDEAVRAGHAGPSRAQQRAQRREKAARLARRSAAAQIALARHESPARGGRFVGLADMLVDDMPHTLAALGAGTLNERRAMIIAKETVALSDEQRAAIDSEIADHIDGLGDKRLQALVKTIAYRMEPDAAADRAARAAGDRRVTVRPAADSMAYLTALLPIGSAVACLAGLKRAADACAPDDPRTQAQRMADTLTAALTRNTTDPTGSNPAGSDAHADDGSETQRQGRVGTRERADQSGRAETPDPVETIRAAYAAHRDKRHGQPHAPTTGREPTDRQRVRTRGSEPDDSAPACPTPATNPHALPDGTDVVVNIVIADDALLADGEKPAHLDGNLPIPAPLARHMITDLPETATVWLRRLYTRPDTGALAAMDSRRRIFPPGMRQQLLLRDQDTCRTPWCDAPARHADHVQPHAHGGPTSIANGQSLSADCNYTRAAPGWSAARQQDGTIVITTPTGHRYHSPEPAVA